MVSIKLIWDGGIIKHAGTATSRYTVEKEKELIQLGYADYKAKKYTSYDSKKSDDLIAIEKYFLGKKTTDVMNDTGFIDNDIIQDASTSLEYIGIIMNMKEHSIAYRILYKDNIYNIYNEGITDSFGMDEDKDNFTKVEYVSTRLNLNEKAEDIEVLEKYFQGMSLQDIDEAVDYSTGYFKGSSIQFLGYSMDNDDYIIQYNGYVYKIKCSGTCYMNYVFDSLELESMIVSNDPKLSVEGDTIIDGNENSGWTITFQETGHIYTLQPNGNITEDASQNPGHSQVNLKELIDTKYAENNERIIQIAYMEEGGDADHKTATFSIFDKKIILYTFNETKGNAYTYIMPIENITVGESQTLKDMFPNYTDIESDTTKIKENTWYRLESTDSRINFGENVIPYSIKDNFSEENIVDKEVYNAIVNNFVV